MVFFSDIFNSVLEHSRHGMIFVFGNLATNQSLTGFIPAFQVFPFIIVYASLMSLLYYLGIMPRIISPFAVIFSHTMETSGAELLYTASDIVLPGVGGIPG